MPADPKLRQSIELFIRQGPELATWLAGLTPAERLAVPIPGKWSIHQLVIHMLDSDLAAVHRMRRIAAEELPLLIAYDETAFSKNLADQSADPELAANIFELTRRFAGNFLMNLPDEAFTRRGIHNQRGSVTLADMVQIYIHHVDHHRIPLIEKRNSLGKPLTT